MSDTFLSEEDVDTLTGILRGRDKQTKEKLQCDFLRSAGIAFFQNARGRPIVVRSAIEGGRQKPPPAAWSPKLVSM